MKKILLSCTTIIALVIIWEALALKNAIDIQFYPPPHLFVSRAFQLFTGDFLQQDFLASMSRFILAAIISVPLACLLGIWTGSSKMIDQLINPFMAFTYPLPKVAIFPLVLLIFGLGDSSKVVLIAIGMFYLIYINVRSGIKQILNSPLMDIVQIYHIKGFNYYYHFLLKGIRRHFLIGLKASLGYGLLLVVVSEFSVSKNGIGHFIWQSWDQFRIVDMYAGIFILCLLGLILSNTVDVLIDRSRN